MTWMMAGPCSSVEYANVFADDRDLGARGCASNPVEP